MCIRRMQMKWQNDVSFCEGGIVNPNEIVNLLSNDLELESIRDVLSARYERMQTLFRNTAADDEAWRQDGCGIANPQRYKDVLLEIPRGLFGEGNDMWCGVNGILSRPDVGIDLPTWMQRRGVQPRQRIMVIAEVPQRARHGAGMLLLSSPWAFHSMEYRALPKNRLIRSVIEAYMCEKNAVVYMTDCRKIYDGVGMAQRQHEVSYRRILQREIDLFGPTTIIGFGSKVLEALCPDVVANSDEGFAHRVCHHPYETTYNGIRALFFAHPSSANAATLNCVVSNIREENPGLSRDEALFRYYTNWN